MKKFILLISVFALFANMSAADVTVRFKAPDTWAEVAVYTYSPTITADWPGDDITATKDADGFYSFTYDNTSGINVMFNNKLDGIDVLEKTDIYRTAGSGDTCYEPTTAAQVDDGKQWNVTAVECPGTVVTGNTTVRFQVPSHWERVMVYTYEPESDWGFWDKELLNMDAERWCSFTFDMTTPTIHVMFHNGDGTAMEKTDIFVEQTGTACYETTTIENEDDGKQWGTTPVDCPSSSISEENASGLIAYPNPTTDRVSFISGSGVKSAVVYNSMGQQVQSAAKVEGGIDMAALPAGMYMIAVTLEDGTEKTVNVLKQ